LEPYQAGSIIFVDSSLPLESIVTTPNVQNTL
jgi:hypothetical protein